MADKQIHENDEGIDFRLTFTDAATGTAIDLTAYTGASPDAIEVYFRRPDGTTATKSMTVVDAVNGIAKYISEAGFLTPSGRWSLQGHIKDAQGNTEFKSAIVDFNVHPNLV